METHIGFDLEEAIQYTTVPLCICSEILIVDDEPFNLVILEGILHQLGINRVDKAYNGEEALNKIKKNI